MEATRSYVQWTRLEEQQACALRAGGLPVPEIARRLGRGRNSVSARLRRLGMAERREYAPGKLAQKVRRLNRAGLDDAEIARQLGRDRSTIFAARRRMGLPAVISAQDVRRRGGLARWGKYAPRETGNAVRCIGCDRPCPTYNRIVDAGWLARPMPGDETNEEFHCPRCFAEYGWGDIKTA